MTSVNFSRAMQSAALVAAVLATLPALAQQRPATGQTPRPAAPAAGAAQPAAQGGPAIVNLKADPNQANWTKVCGRDPATQRETCYTTRDFVAENNTPVLAVAVYETKLDASKVERQIRYLLPLTFLLQPGVRTSVDGGQPVAGRYTICVQNGCFAEFAPDNAAFSKIKAGTNLTLQVKNQADREVAFVIPLAGFAQGFDGAPIDPRVIEEEQKRQSEQLERQGEELRRKLQAGQPATPGAIPAPTVGITPAIPVAPKP